MQKNGQLLRLRVGDRVVIKPESEIFATLDENGACGGLPFMPEMLAWCEKEFKVLRCVEKTCVENHPLRRFPANDVVILDGPRCDGSRHDGCKHGCRIFWKMVWLDPIDFSQETLNSRKSQIGDLRGRCDHLKIKQSDGRRYYCQSTELVKATEEFPESCRLKTLRIAYKEIKNGDITILQFLKALVIWIARRLFRKIGSDKRNSVAFGGAPVKSLGLKPGDVVRVKSRAEISQTLNKKLRNKGLGVCAEMLKCCDRVAEVRYRVDRLINETTGEMREIRDTVALHNFRGDASLSEECMCRGVIGDCPRGEIMYWREIWLERMNLEKQ